MMYDIVIPSIPKVSIEYPELAPNLLKAVLNKNGYTCKVFDWNYDLYSRSQYPSILERKDLSFCYEEEFNKLWDEYLYEVSLTWINELKLLNSEWVGLPIFSMNSFLMAVKLMKLIRKHIPKIKIVVGGDALRLSSKHKPNVGEYLKKENLIDHYIIGDGENALVHLLQGDLTFNGIDGNPPDILDINKDVPIPDYSDLNMDNYNEVILINGSRGCIKNCAFCDVNFYTSKFRQRRAENLCDEMVYLDSMYKPKKFLFADNLVNGSLKEFRKLSILMKGKGINWTGQLLCTPKMTEEDYKNAALGGLVGVSIGIESGSAIVRKDINKFFTNEDVYRSLHYLTKYNISVVVMIIIGCPTETEEYFQETLDMLTEIERNKYKIQKINLGGTCGITPHMELYTKYEYTYDDVGNWTYKDNDIKTRIERWYRTYEHCKSIGLKADTIHIERIKKYNV